MSKLTRVQNSSTGLPATIRTYFFYRRPEALLSGVGLFAIAQYFLSEYFQVRGIQSMELGQVFLAISVLAFCVLFIGVCLLRRIHGGLIVLGVCLIIAAGWFLERIAPEKSLAWKLTHLSDSKKALFIKKLKAEGVKDGVSVACPVHHEESCIAAEALREIFVEAGVPMDSPVVVRGQSGRPNQGITVYHHADLDGEYAWNPMSLSHMTVRAALAEIGIQSSSQGETGVRADKMLVFVGVEIQ